MATAGTKRPHQGSEERSKRKKKHKKSATPANKEASAAARQKLLRLAELLQEVEHDSELASLLVKTGGESVAQHARNLAAAIGSPKDLVSKEVVGTSDPSPQISAPDPLPSFEEYSQKVPDALPMLPPILDPELERRVFTHIGTTSGSTLVTDSYERLEYLGDSCIEFIARRLCYHLFPEYSEGELGQLCQSLVNNETISKYSFAYGFDNRLRMPSNFFTSGSKDFAKKFTKIYGDVFEAYAAALVLSNPENGLRKLDQWMTCLWKPLLFKERNKVPVDVDAKGKLARKLLGKGIRIDYVDEDENPETGKVIYTVAAYITGWGWQHQLLGKGKAESKKAAGMLAATEALTNPSTAVIAAIKKDFDAQVAAEREKEGGPDLQKIKMLEDAYKGLEIGL